MKKMKSFLYVGQCEFDEMPLEVNKYIAELIKKGIKSIEILINQTCNNMEYALKWNE